MRKSIRGNWLAVSAFAFALCAVSSHAQGPTLEERVRALEKQQQENQELKDRVKKLESENESLKKMLGVPKPDEPAKNAPAKAGVGNLTLDGLVQVWFLHDPQAAFGANAKGEDTFRLRRSEIRLTGEILPEVGFGIMVDPAKTLKVNTTAAGTLVTGVSVNQSTNILQEAYVQLRLSKMFPEIDSLAPNLEAVIGQQKTYITEEGMRGSAALELVERAQFVRAFNAADRDIGLLLKDRYKYVDYYAGVFNGSGQNTVDTDSEKTVAGHLFVKPLQGLRAGASGLTGIVGTGATEAVQNRFGLDAQFERDRFSLKGEWMRGRDGTLRREGYFIQPGFFLLKDKLQLVGRYDWFDPDMSKGHDIVEEISAALNWFIYKNNAKVQLQYMRRNDNATTDDDLFLINLQTAF